MRNKTLSLLVYIGCVWILVSGCTANPDTNRLPSPSSKTSSPRPSATITPSPTEPATPTQPPKFLFTSITVLDTQEDEGLSSLVFFLNNSSDPVTEVEIRATVHSHSDGTPMWKEFRLPYQHVLPSEEVPFLVSFPAQSSPESIILEVVNFQISGAEDATLEAEITGTTRTPEGKTILVGWITNLENNPAQIHHFYLLTIDSSDQPTAFNSASLVPSSVSSHQRIPFLFALDQVQGQGSVSFHPIIDATIIPNWLEPPFSLPQYPEITLDPQDNLILPGIIQNTDEISRWISAVVVLRYEDQIVSMASLNPPFPLGPGESRAFGLTDFPGWRTRLNELGGHPDDISIEVFFDPLGCSEFKGQLHHLSVEIHGFETTGSTLLIKGSASNPSPQTLSLPSIQAEIRSTAGILHTSGWILIDETILQGQSMSFILVVRLPEGMKLSEMEIDVTGMAIFEEGSLPF